jgi:hypothetical protein
MSVEDDLQLSPGIEEAARSIGRFVRSTLAALPAEAAPDPWPAVLETLRKMARPGSQAEILQLLLDASGDHADRAALFIVRRGRAAGWAARGFEGDPVAERIRQIQIDLEEDTVFREVTRGHRSLAEHDPEADGVSFLRFGQTEPREALYVPLVTRDRVVVVLYADAVGEKRALRRAALEALCLMASLSLERFLLQSRQAGAETERGRAPSLASTEREPALPATGSRAGQPETAAPAHPLEEPATDDDDAARFARLLVTEIKLYHEHDVAQGRAERDLYRRLREPIDRSRRMYEERVAGREAGRDHFEEKLVEILAGGDPDLLGPRDEA